MKYYTIDELKEGMPYKFEKGLRNNSGSAIEAITYCFSIYEPDFEYGFSEKTIITLLLGKLAVEKTNRIYIGQYNLFVESAKNAIGCTEKLELNVDEEAEIIKWANFVLSKLPLVEIENDPSAK